MVKWEVKLNGITKCWGESEKGFPSPEELRMLRSDGYRVYVDGKEVKGGKAG